MTDLEKFIQLYKEFGIEVKVNTVSPDHPRYSGYHEIFLSGGKIHDDIITCFSSPKHDVVLTTDDKFDGFSRYYSNLLFDQDGKFVRQGFWE